MRGDGRSRRVVVVPDAYLNPAPGAADRLADLAEAGWGVVALPQPGLPPDIEAAALAAVVDQLAVFLDDGYQVALAEPDDPAAQRLADRLAADGRRIDVGVAP
jgi:DNA-binding transcriptional LysR family regulator